MFINETGKERVGGAYGLRGVLVSCSWAAVPLAVASEGTGDACWDLDGLETGLQVSEFAGEEADETAGVGEVEVEGEEPADEVRRSGRFWLEERRRPLPSLSPAAVFRRSLRWWWWEESSISPSSYLRAI